MNFPKIFLFSLLPTLLHASEQDALDAIAAQITRDGLQCTAPIISECNSQCSGKGECSFVIKVNDQKQCEYLFEQNSETNG